MRILFEKKPSVIYLTGDKDYEAMANYIYNRYGDSPVLRSRDSIWGAIRNHPNFMTVLLQHNGKFFYYPKWH